jgi:hypothetical protein
MMNKREAAVKSMEEAIEHTKQEELLQQGNPVALEALATMRRIAQYLLSLNRPN